MFAIVEAAGWPIWLLIVASIIVVALIAERLMVLRNKNIVPPGLLETTVQEYRQNGLTDAMLARLNADSPLGRIFAAGLRNAKSTPEVMKEAIEEAGRAAAHELEYVSMPGVGSIASLSTIGTIASISPLLGLFGTVVGMIEIFGAQSAIGNTPAVLAHGISVALYNTAFGLIVAVPSMIFYRHFRAKVTSLVIDMEQQAVKLVEIVHGARR